MRHSPSFPGRVPDARYRSRYASPITLILTFTLTITLTLIPSPSSSPSPSQVFASDGVALRVLAEPLSRPAKTAAGGFEGEERALPSEATREGPGRQFGNQGSGGNGGAVLLSIYAAPLKLSDETTIDDTMADRGQPMEKEGPARQTFRSGAVALRIIAEPYLPQAAEDGRVDGHEESTPPQEAQDALEVHSSTNDVKFHIALPRAEVREQHRPRRSTASLWSLCCDPRDRRKKPDAGSADEEAPPPPPPPSITTTVESSSDAETLVKKVMRAVDAPEVIAVTAAAAKASWTTEGSDAKQLERQEQKQEQAEALQADIDERRRAQKERADGIRKDIKTRTLKEVADMIVGDKVVVRARIKSRSERPEKLSETREKHSMSIVDSSGVVAQLAIICDVDMTRPEQSQLRFKAGDTVRATAAICSSYGGKTLTCSGSHMVEQVDDDELTAWWADHSSDTFEDMYELSKHKSAKLTMQQLRLGLGLPVC